MWLYKYGSLPEMGVPQMHVFFCGKSEKQNQADDLGVTPISGNLHIGNVIDHGDMNRQ